MQVQRLVLKDLRRFESGELAPEPGLNLLVGANGAGKTSVLEALHLMAYGRSFRGRVRDGLIRSGAAALEVFVEWREWGKAVGEARVRRAGVRHAGLAWNGRLDGQDVNHLGELCAALAVISFEPGSHSLVAGGGENRRRYLDRGLFHVEPAFLPVWRRYSRALKQRNALHKTGSVANSQLDAWDHELADAGEAMTVFRGRYLDELAGQVVLTASRMTQGFGILALDLQAGWRRQEMSLADALLLARDRDRASGHTSVGPHRADWSIEFGGLPGREALSRGQAKLVALSMLLAQAADYAGRRGHWPVIALDDLPSELDAGHQRQVLEHLLAQQDLQLFVTATEVPPAWHELAGAQRVFHVEQGRIQG